MANESIRILITDDHEIVREGLRTFLKSQPGIEIIGEANDGAKAVQLAKSLNPDVILMDLVMPVMDGITATRLIIKDNPSARILVLTSFAEDEKVFPAVKAGALGYLLKDSTPVELIDAIKQVAVGESALHPSIARKVLRELNRSTSPLPNADQLTPREIDVLRLVAEGLSNQDIATQLSLSEWTVRTHLRSIMAKLNLVNRTQAALYALREGLAGLE
jgi:two-component system, NarL family, response regulator LiaR